MIFLRLIIVYLLISSNLVLYGQTIKDATHYYFSPIENERGDLVVFPDVDAQYQDGTLSLLKFLGENLMYPKICVELGVQSKLHLRFTVESDGTVSLIQVRLKKEFDCFEEILDQFPDWLNKMKKWTPALADGISVASYFNLPISGIKVE